MPATPTRTTTAVRATETGISRRLLGATATLLLCAACGGTGSSSISAPTGTSRAARPSFSWFRAQPPPAGWRLARISSGAVLAYPTSWSRQHGDTGTATAALRSPGGAFVGYLNITPRQGPEKLSGWAAFRVHHDRDEGDLGVKQLAAATGLRFRTGHGNCVEDSYSTVTHSHYIEIACLVVGSKAATVIVGAAPPGDWAREAPVIKRAIEGLET